MTGTHTPNSALSASRRTGRAAGVQSDAVADPARSPKSWDECRAEAANTPLPDQETWDDFVARVLLAAEVDHDGEEGAVLPEGLTGPHMAVFAAGILATRVPILRERAMPLFTRPLEANAKLAASITLPMYKPRDRKPYRPSMPGNEAMIRAIAALLLSKRLRGKETKPSIVQDIVSILKVPAKTLMEWCHSIQKHPSRLPARYCKWLSALVEWQVGKDPADQRKCLFRLLRDGAPTRPGRGRKTGLKPIS